MAVTHRPSTSAPPQAGSVAASSVAVSSVAAGQPGPNDEIACSIASTLQVIGDRWTFLILRDAFRGVRRFDDFANDLGIARNLLTDRLGKLVEHGILAKVPYQERPVRNEYRLTKKGRDLSPALVAFMHWGDKHLAHDEPPVVLVHDACGEPLDQVFVCWRCDETITPRQIRSRPGARAATPAPRSTPGGGRHVHL